VTDMSWMFYGDTIDFPTFNQPIGNWDVSSVTDMSYMFYEAISFNQPIGNWDVSNVTDMSWMFYGGDLEVPDFNQPIGNWNVSSVTNMTGMFATNEGSSPFNQPIGDWDVSNVTDMSRMFSGASNFNQPIGNWVVSNVTDMDEMFFGADTFNQPIGNWDVSNVTDMSVMFFGANTFNQPIGNWNVSNVTLMPQMFSGATSFSTENYDNLLIGWATKILQPDVVFGANSTPYCNGETARTSIINTYNWTINDAGKDCSSLSNKDFLSTNFSFYPNPTTSTIELNSILSARYTLYSIIGKTMTKGNLTVGKNNIDLSNYTNGVYLLKINTNKGTTTKRIIKH
jgi:surface protein